MSPDKTQSLSAAPTSVALTLRASLGGQDATVSEERVREGKVELGWVVEDEKLPKGAIRLLLNLALLAGDALVRGGRLDVGAERGDGGIELAVRAEGPRILLDPVLRETLETGGRGTIEPRAAGAWLAHSLAAEGAASIRLSDPGSDVLMIGATIPTQG